MRTTALLLFSCACFLGNAWSQPYNISTIAGTPRLLNGSPATSVPLREPIAIAMDAKGNLYIADQADNRIRMVNPSGIISTFAGTGIPGYSGDQGPALQAELNTPSAIALDAAGNMYIADEGNSRVRRIAVDGTINTVAGNGHYQYAGDNGPATSAQMNPVAVAVDSQGNLYIADGLNYRVRKVDTTGNITTIAGTGQAGNTLTGTQATNTQIGFIYDLTVDSAGNVYLADGTNGAVTEITTTGTATVVAGGVPTGTFSDGVPATTAVMAPDGVAIASGSLYISDANIYNSVIHRVDLSTGLIYTLAGSGVLGFAGDGGMALSAELDYPSGILVSGGAIYFADVINARVRMVANSVINSVAGTGIRDNGPAAEAFLNFPEGITIDGTGDILVADTGNAEARECKAGGNINPVQLQ